MDELIASTYDYKLDVCFMSERTFQLGELTGFIDLYLFLICSNHENTDIVKFTRIIEGIRVKPRLIVIDPNDQSIRKEYKIVWK